MNNSRANYSILGIQFGDELFQGELFNLGIPILGQTIAGDLFNLGIPILRQTIAALQVIYSIWGPQFMDELFQGELFDFGTPIGGQTIPGRIIQFGDPNLGIPIWGSQFGDPNLGMNYSRDYDFVIAGCYCGMLLLGVISKIKQNSSDMNEIILAPCDAG
jgi:hypothetical protein